MAIRRAGNGIRSAAQKAAQLKAAKASAAKRKMKADRTKMSRTKVFPATMQQQLYDNDAIDIHRNIIGNRKTAAKIASSKNKVAAKRRNSDRNGGYEQLDDNDNLIRVIPDNNHIAASRLKVRSSYRRKKK